MEIRKNSRNLIFNESDLKSLENVKEFSLDEDSKKLWEATRKEIVCLADFILPGHGPTFKVTTQMKAAFRCSSKK
uniref:Metallo-beta-lactamase domain-containing protein n=1 Tax=Panagrolaimus superbus TaxID=310955 RepID=A0A914Y3Y2_9BILA